MKYFLFLIFLINGHYSFSQKSEQSDSVSTIGYSRINKEYFHSLFKDGKELTLSPLHCKYTKFLAFGGVCAVTTGLIYYVDMDIKLFFQRNRSNATNNLSVYGFERMGSGLYTFPLVGLVFGYGYFAKKEKPKEAALLATKSILFNGIIVSAIKYGFQRKRPQNTNNSLLFFGPFGDGKNHSFASGHTSTAFAIATAFAFEYQDRPIIPIVAYVLATGVGLSRINDNKHWASDVFFGAILGHSISHFLYKNQFKKRKMSIVIE